MNADERARLVEDIELSIRILNAMLAVLGRHRAARSLEDIPGWREKVGDELLRRGAGILH